MMKYRTSGNTRDGDSRPLSEIYATRGEKWADLEAAAQLLEDSKSAFMAQRQISLGDVAVNRAEQIVKASPEWGEYIGACVTARRAANLAKVELEVVRMRFTEWNNQQANARQEMKMSC